MAVRMELPMPMIALASDTWYNNGEDLDVALQCSQWLWQIVDADVAVAQSRAMYGQDSM